MYKEDIVTILDLNYLLQMSTSAGYHEGDALYVMTNIFSCWFDIFFVIWNNLFYLVWAHANCSLLWLIFVIVFYFKIIWIYETVCIMYAAFHVYKSQLTPRDFLEKW